MKRIFYVFMAALLAVLMIPAVAAADVVPIQVGDIGFIPNSGEASVSKVNLETGAQIARYWTAPRLGDMVDFEGNASAVANTVPPYAWRTSRIAADENGDVWVLNVGADKYLSSYVDNQPNPTGFNFSTYTAYVAANGLVGSLVRIQGNTSGLGTTNNDHASPLAFGTDEAVQVFPVGTVGEMPRAIAIEPGTNHIWVGFYATGEFQQYSYTGGVLSEEGAPVTVPGARPYQAVIDSDGFLWFSSRTDANPTVPGGIAGVGYFSIAAPATQGIIPLATAVNPYAILLDESGADPVIWATAFSQATLYKITSDGTPAIDATYPISSASELRGMAFDAAGMIWIADTAGGTLHRFNPGDGTNSETLAITGAVAGGAKPVGVGVDASGNMWAICRNDNAGTTPGFIAEFDATSMLQLTTITVGYRPYAYGDFVSTANIGIQIIKYVSVGGNVGNPPAAPWEDADTAPGPTADVDQTVYFKYVVTNLGDLPLANVVVKDDNETPLNLADDITVPYLSGDTNADSKLDVTETWIFGPISETATAGQHTNVGRVSGWYPSSPDGTEVTDDNPANYFCAENFQGCTPGFWKNNWDKHAGSAWADTGYAGTQTFFDVFGRTITIRVGGAQVPPVTNPTLVQALGANGGDINALARAAVAALLNAASPEITYQIATPQEVITMVQAAIDAGAPYPLAGTLDGYNNAGCVINQQGLPQEHDD